MFGLLKNKLTSFIKSFAGREEKKEDGPGNAPVPEQPKLNDSLEKGAIQTAQPEQQPGAEPAKARQAAPLGAQPGKQAHEEPAKPRQTTQTEPPKQKGAQDQQLARAAQPEKEQETPLQAHSQAQQGKRIEKIPVQPQAKIQQEAQKKSMLSSVAEAFSPKARERAGASQGMGQAKPANSTQTHEVEKSLSDVGQKAMSGSRGISPKIGIGTAIKSFFSNEITIGEGEVSDLLSELELSLLEADVAYDVSLSVTEQLRGRLVGMKVPKGEVEARTKQAIREVLESIMDNDRKFDLAQRVRNLQKPVKVLFVGPNGAGKTTTMAKVARMLMDSGFTVVFSASDTFRAAAIEQAEVHAGRLGVAIVKSKYGADPSSVAFDAINYARSHSIDVVLIDSAGRQDTNTNLLDELRKMDRVAKPDIKIYIGESIGGNAIIEQIRAFNSSISLDGAILTKLDCDAKGGTAISVSHATGIPVLYLGVGQAYADLVPFDPRKIAQEIMN